MDSSAYFWQSNENGNESLQSSVATTNFIQHVGTSQQQETLSQNASISISSTSNTVPVVNTQSSESPGFSHQENNANLQSQPDRNVVVETPMPIEISNPDAIEPKPRTYTCRICQMMFPNKSAVTVHSRLHTDHQGKPYRCSFCDKGFSTNFYLKQHERIHSGQKPYKCPMCEQSFKQLSHVQQHVRTHTGVRPYKCHWPGCGKAFLQQSHLKSHEARHVPKDGTAEKPYKCHWPDCGKSFGQLTNLKSHVARHTPGSGKSKGRKRGHTQKKDENDKNESQTSTLSLQDVINQAAAAADIVPGTSNHVTEESEIRPYLCPGCSKVYVREGTFKKHLEECKTKLQLSISATVTALGINAPPDDVMANYNPAPTIQLSSTTQEKVPAPKKEANIVFTTQTITQNHSTSASDTTPVHKPDIIQIKEEATVLNAPQPPTSIPEEQIFSTSGYKLEPISNPVQVTAATTPQNSILHFDTTTGEIMPVSEVTIGPANEYQLPTAHSSSAVVSDGKNPPTTAEHMVVNLNPEDAGHSTINQAAIRWQWDQPVPRLNFP